ncbi:MAG: cytochrome c [Thermoleophilia bacterium]|nr:cytochrome c [Thermoleophilia bacterium]
MAGVLAVAALGIAAVGCGGSDDSGDSGSPAAGTTAAAPPAATTAPPAATTAPAPSGGTGDAAAGKSVFTSNCASCHTLADAGASGAVGPNLDDLKPDQATVQAQVTNGGGAMPAFAGTLSDQQIMDVAAYVSSAAGG